MPTPQQERLLHRLVTAALDSGDEDGPLDEARAMAATTRDRQLVAIATAHLRGDRELVDALARDHLADHPDSVLVASIADASRRGLPAPRPAQNQEPS